MKPTYGPHAPWLITMTSMRSHTEWAKWLRHQRGNLLRGRPILLSLEFEQPAYVSSINFLAMNVARSI